MIRRALRRMVCLVTSLFLAQTFYWSQLENLYFREKKFSIEVNDRQVRKFSAGSKERLLVDTTRKPSPSEIKVHAWYGSAGLIKSIWIMSISQHHYYLDRKQSKVSACFRCKFTRVTSALRNIIAAIKV